MYGPSQAELGCFFGVLFAAGVFVGVLLVYVGWPLLQWLARLIAGV
jgi:hypothetical protein